MLMAHEIKGDRYLHNYIAHVALWVCYRVGKSLTCVKKENDIHPHPHLYSFIPLTPLIKPPEVSILVVGNSFYGSILSIRITTFDFDSDYFAISGLQRQNTKMQTMNELGKWFLSFSPWRFSSVNLLQLQNNNYIGEEWKYFISISYSF